jgi:hypothetical protein
MWKQIQINGEMFMCQYFINGTWVYEPCYYPNGWIMPVAVFAVCLGILWAIWYFDLLPIRE